MSGCLHYFTEQINYFATIKEKDYSEVLQSLQVILSYQVLNYFF